MLTKFKPQLLFKDAALIKKQTAEYVELAEYANQAIEPVKELFDRELKPDEMISIIKAGWRILADLIRRDSQWPNAEINTLLNLLGKDGTKAKNVLSQIKNRLLVDGLEIENGQFKVKDSIYKDIENKYTYYTENQTQNEKFDKIKNLCDSLNDAIELEIIKSPTMGTGMGLHHHLGKFIALKKSFSGEQYRFTPNFEKLKFLE